MCLRCFIVFLIIGCWYQISICNSFSISIQEKSGKEGVVFVVFLVVFVVLFLLKLEHRDGLMCMFTVAAHNFKEQK